MQQAQKQPASILKKGASAGPNIVSKQVVELHIPVPFKGTSSTGVRNTTASSAGAYRSAGTSTLTCFSNSRRNALKTDSLRCSAIMQGTYDSGKNKKEMRKHYKKTLPKMENYSDSSSYCVSRGQVIYEEFWDSDVSQGQSSSLSSFSTCQKPSSQDHGVKMVGIKNVNYRDAKFSETEQARPYKAPRFVPIAESGRESKAYKNPNIMLKHIPLARKGLSSQLFLGSLITPGDEDIAAFRRKQINERKKRVLNKWLEDHKMDFKTVPISKRRCTVKTL